MDAGFSAQVDVELDSFQNSIIYLLLVPFDPEFKKELLSQLKSTIGYERYAAARDLRHYKDQEVIAELKKCLTDDHIDELPVDPTKKGSPTKRYYAVRRAAYELLREWDVDVARPVLEAPPPPLPLPEGTIPPPRPVQKPLL